MAQTFTAVNLSQLPPPQVVETLSFETIRAEIIADFIARQEEAGQPYTAVVEGDPAYKMAEASAYREMIVRARINESAKAVMLAYAKGADLDNIGANANVFRLTVQEADATTIPPTPLIMESDEDFRARIQLAPEAITTAGSEGSYQYHTRSADGKIKDVQVVSPLPGQVLIYISNREGNGSATLDMIANATAALSKLTVRPLTDQVTVMSAAPINYAITAQLQIYEGPDPAVVLSAAQAAVLAYTENQKKIGYDVTTSGIIGALQQPGVHKVTLTAPVSDVVVDEGEVGYCTSITVTQVPLNV
jgi:phage-related baseplate assembly protein